MTIFKKLKSAEKIFELQKKRRLICGHFYMQNDMGNPFLAIFFVELGIVYTELSLCTLLIIIIIK